MQKAEYIYRITSEIVEDLARNNVRYAELRIAPFLHIDGGLYLEEVVESVLKALNDGEKDNDINTNLILIAMRDHESKKSLEVVKTAEKYLNYGVVGVDLAGNEADFPPDIHQKAFEKAAEYGLHRTVHAGEAAGPKNIKTAVEKLFAERIGHGVKLKENRNLYKLLKDNDIALEVCLLSNLQTNAVQKLENHPVKEYFNNDIPITINTDNTTVSNTDINNEYSILFKKLDFDFVDFKKIIFNGIKYSFADKSLKEKLNLEFEKEISILEKT